MPSMFTVAVCLYLLGLVLSATRPNFILMMADDMGWGDTKYNNGTAFTPSLDAFASSSGAVRFDRFYSGAPVCSPTRGSFITGRNPLRDCIFFVAAGKLPVQEFTVAQAAKKAGYRTMHIGKWHLGNLTNDTWGPIPNPGEVGFDEWYSTKPTLEASATLNCNCFKPIHGCITGHYPAPLLGGMCGNYFYANETNVVHNETNKLQGDDSNHQVDVLEEFVQRQVTADQPFLAVVWFHNCHSAFVTPDHFRDMYLGHNYSGAQLDYYGCLTALDSSVGRIRAMLRKLKIEDNTVLTFNSDNGPEGDACGPYGCPDAWPGSTNGLRGRKRSLFEGGVRVPGLLEWPAVVQHNTITNYPACTTDWLPTVMDILNVTTDNPTWPLDGSSLLPFLQQQTNHRASPLYHAYRLTYNYTPRGNITCTDWLNHYDYGTKITIVDNSWKLVVPLATPGKGQTDVRASFCTAQLYNLDDDPYEQHDLAAVPHLQELRERLQFQVGAWRESVVHSIESEANCSANWFPGPHWNEGTPLPSKFG